MSLYKCPGCGASVRQIDPEKPQVSCEYCGALLAERPKPKKRVVHVPPSGAAPRRSPLAGVVIVMALLSMLGAGAVFIVQSVVEQQADNAKRRGQPNRPTPVTRGSQSPAGVPGSTRSRTAPDRVDNRGVCPLGDRAAIRTRTGVSVLDIAAGTSLHTTELPSSKHRLFCLNDAWFAIQSPDFALAVYSASEPETAHTVALSDEINDWRAGPDCVRVKTRDRKSHELGLPPGDVPPKRCRTTGGKRCGNGSVGMDTFDFDVTQQVGAREVRISKRRRGTPLLTVRLKDGRKTVYEEELSLIPSKYGIPLAADASRVFFVANPHPEGTPARLHAMDFATGEIRWTANLGDTVATFGTSLWMSSDRVLAISEGAVHAYQAETGEPDWSWP